MNGIGITIFLVLACITLVGSRRAAVMALMAGVLFLTQAQSIDLGGVHLSAMRLLALTSSLRIVVRRELIARFHRIDGLVAVLYVYTVLVFVARSAVDQAYITGISVDAALSYFIFRCLISDADDVRFFLRGFTLLLIPFVFMLAYEAMTGENLFAAVGGLSFVERGGRPRSMGSFRHPSLLGTLGAVLLPLYLALALEGRGRFVALVGIGLCVAIIGSSNSGGPASAAAVGLMGWSLWLVRQRMVFVKRGLVAMLVLLGIFMKAPLWYLPAKASTISGGDGWHRSYLMEVAFREIDKWWLAGMDMDLTQDWFDYRLSATGSADITNQYLYFGLTAGLVAMALFVLLLTWAFKAVGRTMDVAAADDDPRRAQYVAWGLGCCVAVHAATWFGITYNFDQTHVLWSLQLAAIASIAAGAAPSLAVEESSTVKAPSSARWEHIW